MYGVFAYFCFKKLLKKAASVGNPQYLEAGKASEMLSALALN